MLVVETAVKIGGRISRLQVRISGSTFTSSTCEGCLERLRLWSLLALHRLTTGHSSRLWSLLALGAPQTVEMGWKLESARALARGGWGISWRFGAASAGCYLLADQCGVESR